MPNGLGKKVGVIVVPYDSGAREWRMGRGPGHLARGGLVEDLGAGEETVVDEALRTENAAAFELMSRVSERVRASVAAGRFPLVLSGNCSASVGTVAGVGGEALGIVWFDAHADFNTPETTASGFLDGMALAMAAGRCWVGMTGSMPGFVPVRGEDVVLVGARGVDPGEGRELANAGVAVVGLAGAETEGDETGLAEALDGLSARVGRVHVHVDLDVLDPELVGPANALAPSGGLSAEELERALGLVADRFDVVSGTMSSYDPDLDGEGRVLDAARRLARALAGHAGGRTVG